MEEGNLIAEINGKISRSGSNLSERLEDQLTGDFLGNLRYIPFEKGMKIILEKAKYIYGTTVLSDEMKRLGIQDIWNDKISFWPSDNQGELDAILEVGNLVIGIEVKYESGLSSKDNVQDVEKTNNQLIREMRILRGKALADNKQALLLFIAKQESAELICQQVYDRYFKVGQKMEASLYCLSWEQILQELKGIVSTHQLNAFEKLILQDLTDLMMRKGFDRFKGFEIGKTCESKDLFFDFNEEAIPSINFNMNKQIERAVYYGFER